MREDEDRHDRDAHEGVDRELGPEGQQRHQGAEAGEGEGGENEVADCLGVDGVGFGREGEELVVLTLRERVEPRLLEVFETAARYQMYHAFALIAVALMLARSNGITAAVLGPASGTGLAVASGWLFVIGTAQGSGKYD